MKKSMSGGLSGDGNLAARVAGRRRLGQIVKIKDDSNHQAAAGTHGNVLLVAQVVEGDLEAIAARARIVIDLESFVKCHVFDLDLVVD